MENWSVPPQPAPPRSPAGRAFEAAWLAGSRPRIEDHLGWATSPDRAALLRELLTLDVQHRRRAGEVPCLEDYLPRFPDDVPAVRALFERLRPAAETMAHQPAPAGADASGFPTLPGYEILAQLAGGGMGIVYKARQTSLNRTVALKMIRAGDAANRLELARFRQEATAVAALNHPHILPIYEFGDYAGLPYFTMEFVEGGSLEHRLANGPLPPRDAAELVATLARTVQYVHDRHIVHRDLKPANILLQPSLTQRRQDAKEDAKQQEGSLGGSLGALAPLRETLPKITDFGIAKRLDEDQGLTAPHTILGTPSYMAPEQAAGHAREVGPAADVYALGAILYECLTGRPPFQGATRQLTLVQVITEPPAAPTRVHPGVPADLEAVCLKCLEKEPGNRYASAGELADDLGRYLRGEPLSIKPLTGLERYRRWAGPLYDVLEIIGEGNQAVACKARMAPTSRMVALKLWKGEPPDSPTLQRLQTEAQALARLEHPNIAQVYDVGKSKDGRWYIALEFVGGPHLAQIGQASPRPVSEAAAEIEALAWAVQHAHQRGIRYCDLRTSDIRLTADGVPKIVGFGPGSLLSPEMPVPDYKSLVGSRATLAPEQITGRSEAIGPATDVHALGGTLYLLLTGGFPFSDRPSEDRLRAIVGGQPTPPRQLRPEVPPDLEAICLQCLAAEPDERYASAGDLAEDLRCFREGEPVSLGLTNEWEKLARWAGYQILRPIGPGEMTPLHMARQISTGRLAALRLELPENPEHRARLQARYQAEAEIHSRLRHPNIVELYEAGEAAGCPFLAWEFVDGPSLERKLGGKPLPAREAATLLETLSRALHYAHQKGVIHRDVKPAHIQLTADGTLKLTDFGLARRYGPEHPGAELPGAIVGTPAYMPPEQFTGRHAEIGPASDVYAVGVILYEMLTGRRPFQGPKLMHLLTQALHQEPKPPSRLVAKVPADLEAICLKCLRKEPKDRYATAALLADDLRCFLEGKPVQARPPGVWGHLRRWVRRPP
jgi:serine/threonine protein kinase